MNVQAQLRGTQRFVNRLTRMKTTMRSEARRFTERVERVMFDKAREYTSLTDHTLADLARLGHPYARRFAPNYLHPDYLVHQQTGSLTAGLQTDPVIENPPDVFRGIVRNIDWKDIYIQFGTWKMRARPYMAQVAEDVRPETLSAAAQMLRGNVQGVTVSVGLGGLE